MVNFPAFFTSLAPAKASARPVLVSALPLAFLAAFIAGAMLCGAWRGFRGARAAR